MAIGRLKQQTEESDRLRQRETDALEALRKDAERQVTSTTTITTTITTTMIMTDAQPLVVYHPNPCSDGAHSDYHSSIYYQITMNLAII